MLFLKYTHNPTKPPTKWQMKQKVKKLLNRQCCKIYEATQ